jgi:very-short-patch-repair endonuclease
MIDKIHNIKTMRANRKKLRNRLTPAEAKLWAFLKNGQIEKRKFRRQHSVGPYVLDFYCPSERLCIELDGTAHFTENGYEYDTARTEYLEAHNICVIRFENKDVFENTEGVLEEIRKKITSKQTKSSPPILGGVTVGRGGSSKSTNHPLPSGYPSLTKEGSL